MTLRGRTSCRQRLDPDRMCTRSPCRVSAVRRNVRARVVLAVESRNATMPSRLLARRRSVFRRISVRPDRDSPPIAPAYPSVSRRATPRSEGTSDDLATSPGRRPAPDRTTLRHWSANRSYSGQSHRQFATCLTARRRSSDRPTDDRALHAPKWPRRAPMPRSRHRPASWAMARAAQASAPRPVCRPIASTVLTRADYGAVAIAIVVVALATVVSRVLYNRRARAYQAQRMRNERQEAERRGEGVGLPTCPCSACAVRSDRTDTQSRLVGRPADNADYARSYRLDGGNGPAVPPDARSQRSRRSFHQHFHFHMPSLPAALLRPVGLVRRQTNHSTFDPPTSSEPAPPSYDPTGAPPKWDDAPRDPPPAGHGESSSVAIEMEDRSTAPALDYDATPAATAGEAPFVLGDDDAFIHPEERRRREAGSADSAVDRV